jgi:hypothetical protein
MSVFTPKAHDGLVRYNMTLNTADQAAWNSLSREPQGIPSQVIVTDQYTGRKFLVQRASCGQRCYCDAEVVREIEDY